VAISDRERERDKEKEREKERVEATPLRRLVRDTVETQAAHLTQELAQARDHFRAQLDSLTVQLPSPHSQSQSAPTATTTGVSGQPSQPSSQYFAKVYDATLEMAKLRQLVDDHFVRIEASAAALRDAVDRERHVTHATLGALEARLAALETQQLDAAQHADRVYTLSERRFREVSDACEKLTVVVEASDRASAAALSHTTAILGRVAETESGVRLTQDRLEAQIRWGNELEESTAQRIEELQRVAATVKSEILTLQRSHTSSSSSSSSHHNKSSGGDAETRHAIAMLESEVQVLHRRLGNALRVFAAEPKEPVLARGTDEEDIFLLRTSHANGRSGSGSGSRKSSHL
jgi:hypothetical protein